MNISPSTSIKIKSNDTFAVCVSTILSALTIGLFTSVIFFAFSPTAPKLFGLPVASFIYAGVFFLASIPSIINSRQSISISRLHFLVTNQFGRIYADFDTREVQSIAIADPPARFLNFWFYFWPFFWGSRMIFVTLKNSKKYQIVTNTKDAASLERAIRQSLEAHGQKVEQPDLENTV